VSLTRKVAYHLHDTGDADWLKTRTAIITFEECWPLGSRLHLATDLQSTLETLVHVAKSVKVKDATGLGVLAYALSIDDSSVLAGDAEDQHIQGVAEAIRNPKDFWTWATQKCSQGNQQLLVQASHKAYRRGGWPWDRALIQAAAYLTVTTGVPNVRLTERTPEEVPLWVGLDKHTPQGKKALQDVAKLLRIPARQLSWISFYLESALANESAESYWWSRESRWRLKQVGLNNDEAYLIWDKAQPMLINILREEVESLQGHLDNSSESEVLETDAVDPQAQQYHLPGF
jgi:hypothetical protein